MKKAGRVGGKVRSASCGPLRWLRRPVSGSPLRVWISETDPSSLTWTSSTTLPARWEARASEGYCGSVRVSRRPPLARERARRLASTTAILVDDASTMAWSLRMESDWLLGCFDSGFAHRRASYEK